jgi:hypothetical protein
VRARLSEDLENMADGGRERVDDGHVDDESWHLVVQKILK